MRIISWNCNGAFRCKFHTLEKFHADLWVIQECENPDYFLEKNICVPSENHIWCGDRKFKGLGIFGFNNYHLQKANFFSSQFKYILPVEVLSPNAEKFLLTGIWASLVKSNPDWNYIGQVCIFIEKYASFFNSSSIFLGDFNSNMKWNHHHKKGHNYLHFLQLMKNIGMESVYHDLNNIQYGQEKISTSYFRRHPNHGFHIDYIFMNKNKIKNLKNFEILGINWLNYSDHVPLILDIPNEQL